MTFKKDSFYRLQPACLFFSLAYFWQSRKAVSEKGKAGVTRRRKATVPIMVRDGRAAEETALCLHLEPVLEPRTSMEVDDDTEDR